MSGLIDPTVLSRPLAGLSAASHWYVAFSGGVDSTVLLHLLQRWTRSHPDSPPLTAVHINHAMQAEADEWQIHCEWLCRLLDIPLLARRVEVQSSSRGSEAAARDARYRVFQELLASGAVLFLGHHLDDQVETFFLRLMRGAGVHGLAGMPARRQLGQGTLARPLLDLNRAQLERYALEHGLKTVEDPSNTDTAMDRNFLRSELLPLLASRWPGYRRTVTRAGAHMAGTVTALEAALPAPATVFSAIGDPGVALAELLAGTDEAAAVGLRRWLLEAGCLAPDQAQLDEFLRQLRTAGAGRHPRLACGDYCLQRYQGCIYLLPDWTGEADPQPLELAAGEYLDVPGVGEIALVPASGAGLSLAEDETVLLGWRRGGERCRPVSRSGGNSLKKLLQEYDIPPWWRDRVPLLYLEEEMLAVGDLWLCQSSRWRAAPDPEEPLWEVSWEPHTRPAYD